MKFKAAEVYGTIAVIVTDDEGNWTGEIAEEGYKTMDEAKKAAKNFADWN